MSKRVEVVPVVDVDRLTECTEDGCSRPLWARNRCRTCCDRLNAAERRERRAVVDEDAVAVSRLLAEVDEHELAALLVALLERAG